MPNQFTYTLIPAAESEPFVEHKLVAPDALEENIGCLAKALNAHYSLIAPMPDGADGEAATARVVETMKQHLDKKQAGETGGAEPDPKMLGMLAGTQTIDIVQLLPATQATDWVGVNLYVDDKGVAKQSPINARASAICSECGIPTEVRGDAFLARLRDDQNDIFERQVFPTPHLAGLPDRTSSVRRGHTHCAPAGHLRT